MDGLDSEMFQYFKSLLVRGFIEIRKNLEDILPIIETMVTRKYMLSINLF